MSYSLRVPYFHFNNLKKMNQKINHYIFALFCAIFAVPALLSGQCTVAVAITNETRVSTNEFTFDVVFNSSGPSMNLANLQGGVIGLPSGVTGNFTLVTPPSGGLNSTLTLTTPTVSGNIVMRWTQAALGTPGVPMPNTPALFATFRYLRTGGTALPLTAFPLTWQATGGAALQIVGYCGGVSPAIVYSTASGNLAAGGGTVPAALPIELTEFSGKTMERSNMLTWVTAIEQNVREHVIERSADGYSNWTKIGRKAGQISSRVATKYSIEDRAPLAKGYYRLRSVDIDTKESVSTTIILTRKSEQFAIINVFPNPTDARVTVQFTAKSEAPVTIRVVDLMGRLVLEQQTGVGVGTNAILVNMEKLAAGAYNVTIVNDTETAGPVRVVKVL